MVLLLEAFLLKPQSSLFLDSFLDRRISQRTAGTDDHSGWIYHRMARSISLILLMRLRPEQDGQDFESMFGWFPRKSLESKFLTGCITV